jgi:hypothetical protein
MFEDLLKKLRRKYGELFTEDMEKELWNARGKGEEAVREALERIFEKLLAELRRRYGELFTKDMEKELRNARGKRGEAEREALEKIRKDLDALQPQPDAWQPPDLTQGGLPKDDRAEYLKNELKESLASEEAKRAFEKIASEVLQATAGKLTPDEVSVLLKGARNQVHALCANNQGQLPPGGEDQVRADILRLLENMLKSRGGGPEGGGGGSGGPVNSGGLVGGGGLKSSFVSSMLALHLAAVKYPAMFTAGSLTGLVAVVALVLGGVTLYRTLRKPTEAVRANVTPDAGPRQEEKKPDPPPKQEDGTGNYGPDLRDVDRQVGKTAGRGERFLASLRGQPVFGGIVLGNAADEKSARPLEAAFRRKGGQLFLEVKVRQGDGEATVRYSDFTPTDLWSAYHVVRPTAAMREKYGVGPAEPNLVSCAFSPHLNAGDFSLHPALAGTPAARAAMLLDLLPFTPGYQFDEMRSRWASLQWYDDPALISADATGALTVLAASEPRYNLLRVRFWGPTKAAPWLEGLDGDERDREIGREVLRRANRRLVHGPEKETRDFIDLATFTTAFRASAREALAEIGAEVKGRPDRARPLPPACRQPVERFARLLAVLNWLADAPGVAFPALPADVRPARLELPTRLSVREAEALLRRGPG